MKTRYEVRIERSGRLVLGRDAAKFVLERKTSFHRRPDPNNPRDPDPCYAIEVNKVRTSWVKTTRYIPRSTVLADFVHADNQGVTFKIKQVAVDELIQKLRISYGLLKADVASCTERLHDFFRGCM